MESNAMEIEFLENILKERVSDSIVIKTRIRDIFIMNDIPNDARFKATMINMYYANEILLRKSKKGRLLVSAKNYTHQATILNMELSTLRRGALSDLVDGVLSQ